MDPIDRWAVELRQLRRGEDIRRFRQRFDKATAQRIIRSKELSDVDRAAISLALNFQGEPPRGFGVFLGSAVTPAGLPDPDTLDTPGSD